MERFNISVPDIPLPLAFQELHQTCPGSAVLIPAGIDLETLISHRSDIFIDSGQSFYVWEQYKKVSSSEHRWIFVPDDVLPGSEDKTFEEQKALVEALPGRHMISGVDLTICRILMYIEGKEGRKESNTWVRCPQMVNVEGEYEFFSVRYVEGNRLEMTCFNGGASPDIGAIAAFNI